MRGGAPKKNFFDGNALSGSIHSTYQLASLQTDQIPTLGQPTPQLPGPARGLGAGAGLGRGWLELCEWLLSGELDWSWADGGDEISDIDLVQTVCGGAH